MPSTSPTRLVCGGRVAGGHWAISRTGKWRPIKWISATETSNGGQPCGFRRPCWRCSIGSGWDTQCHHPPRIIRQPEGPHLAGGGVLRQQQTAPTVLVLDRGQQQSVISQQGQRCGRGCPLPGSGQGVIEGHGEPWRLALLAEGQHRSAGLRRRAGRRFPARLGWEEPAEFLSGEWFAPLLGVPVCVGVPGVQVGDRQLCRVLPFPQEAGAFFERRPDEGFRAPGESRAGEGWVVGPEVVEPPEDGAPVGWGRSGFPRLSAIAWSTVSGSPGAPPPRCSRSMKA